MREFYAIILGENSTFTKPLSYKTTNHDKELIIPINGLT